MLIAVLITCHNRKEKTLQCLNLLFNQIGIDTSFKVEVFLVDDRCTDGTPDAVKEQFPFVNIIEGDGNLFWNRGMYLAWTTASDTKEFDYYLWLNDDTFLFENAIEDLLSYKIDNALITGTTKSKTSLNFTYGGYKNKLPVVPNGHFQSCDYANGNILLISKTIFEKLGKNDPIFHHALGDFDYTLRAKKLGFEIINSPQWSGYCENHINEPKWIIEKNFIIRLKNLYTPLSGCSPNEYFVFDLRHNGIFLALIHYISIHIRCVFPNLFKLLKINHFK